MKGQRKNDKIMTPIYIAEMMVNHFKPHGKILEPCCGTGNFLKFIPNADWCEIDKGSDFMDAVGHWDWIITNPPFSKYRAFLNKSMEVADNIVFFQNIAAIFYKARIRDIYLNNFRIKEILLLDTPSEYNNCGFQFACVYIKRAYNGETILSSNMMQSYFNLNIDELSTLEIKND